MTDSPIKFGTDGWRAIIADEFTFENVRACAQGTAQYIREAGWPSVASSSATTLASPLTASQPPSPR